MTGKKFARAMLAALAVLCAPQVALAQDNSCDRACLSGLLDSYFAALVAHDSRQLPLSNDIKYTEPTKVTTITVSVTKL